MLIEAPRQQAARAAGVTAVDGLDATSSVLDAVRRRGARSRTEIADLTGLGRSVVTSRVAELIAARLIEEDGSRASTGGRPPRHLRFAARAGHLLTADLGATSIDVALADLDGTIRAHRAAQADIARGPDATLSQVEQLFEHLLASVPDPGPRWGVGVGVPGPVEFSTGRPSSPPIMPGWHDYPVRERLEERLGARVWVDNDVNIMAMGEWRAGIARGHVNVVWVKVGTGIGAGLISDGILHRGAQGAAGDVGHMQVADDEVVCRCGNVGCLEAVAGGAALARDARDAATSGRSRFLAEALRRDGAVSARTVALGAMHGDPACVELLQRSARLIGQMLASIVNFFNPSLVVVGGGVAEAGNLFLATIRETVYRRSLPLATRDLRIEPTELGPMAGVVGAAAMVADELFSREQLGTTLAHLARGGRSTIAVPAAAAG